MDAVRIFEDYCTTNNYEFVYGTKAVQNLLQLSEFEDKIHLLLDPVRRISNISEFGFNAPTNTYSGRYLLVKEDDFDSTYIEKYTNHIEPLLTIYKQIEKQLIACDGFDLVQHENIDVTDALDANLSGLVCTFQLRVYE